MTQISFFSVDAVTTGSVFPPGSRSLMGARRHHLDVGLLRHRGGRLGRSVREGVVLGSRRSRIVRVPSRRRSPSGVISPATGSETSRSANLSRHEEKNGRGTSAGRKNLTKRRSPQREQSEKSENRRPIRAR